MSEINYWDDLKAKYKAGEISFDDMWKEKEERDMRELNFTPAQYYRADCRDLDNNLKEFFRSLFDFQGRFSTGW